MKIIAISNYNDPLVSDRVIATKVNLLWGERIVAFLNDKHSGAFSPDFFSIGE